jgi:hypothetical protein
MASASGMAGFRNTHNVIEIPSLGFAFPYSQTGSSFRVVELAIRAGLLAFVTLTVPTSP